MTLYTKNRVFIDFINWNIWVHINQKSGHRRYCHSACSKSYDDSTLFACYDVTRGEEGVPFSHKQFEKSSRAKNVGQNVFV